MKILAVGDRQIGVGNRLDDQEAVGEKIVDLALARNVDLILDGGDVFEGAEVNDEHREAYIRPLERLGGRIPIIACLGNGRHDRSMKPANALQTLRHIPGLQVASRPRVFVRGGAGIAVLPWVHPGRWVAAHNGDVPRDEVNSMVADLLFATARGLRAELDGDAPAILLLHWSLLGATTSTGMTTEMLGEPVLDAHELHDLGFDAIIASHIHRPQVLCDDPHGWVTPNPAGDLFRGFEALYTGSPMIHDHGEAGHPHGVWIVDAEVGASTAEFVPIESRPFVTADFDFTREAIADGTSFEDEIFGAAHLAAFQAKVPVDGAVVRVRYRATQAQQRRIDVSLVRCALIEAGAHVVKIEPDIVREDRTRVDGVNEDLEPLDAYDLWAEANAIDPTLAARARARMSVLLEQVA